MLEYCRMQGYIISCSLCSFKIRKIKKRKVGYSYDNKDSVSYCYSNGLWN